MLTTNGMGETNIAHTKTASREKAMIWARKEGCK
jgi:hypothetical protein